MKARWKVKFMRKGSEPPMPFGKTSMVVAAESRAQAIEIVSGAGIVSPNYKTTASKTDEPVSHTFGWTEAT